MIFPPNKITTLALLILTMNSIKFNILPRISVTDKQQPILNNLRIIRKGQKTNLHKNKSKIILVRLICPVFQMEGSQL